MIVVSSELTEITLEVPENQHLVDVTKDGKPVLARRLEDRRWRVSLGPAHLPQLIETVCRAERNITADRGKFQLGRPRLLNGNQPIPVEVGLWTIGLPGRSNNWKIEQAAVVARAQQAALRLDRLVSIADAALPAATDLPISEGRDWYLPWATRLAAMRQHALSTSAAQADASVVLQVDSSSQEQLAKASEQLDAWIEQCDEMFEASGAAPLETSTVSQVASAPWEVLRRPGSEWIYCVADGDSAELLANLENRAPTPGESKVRGLLAVLGTATALILLMRHPAAYDLLYRWPQAIAFLLGTAWWAWLEPSWVGLLIAAASMGLAMRTGWPSRSLPTEGSTVVRAGGTG